MEAQNTDEFDRWLVQGAPPQPAPPLPSNSPAPATASSSWFPLPALPENTPSFSSLLGSATPAADIFSATVGGVAGKLRAAVEESVSQFQREQEAYCTQDAQRAEKQEMSKFIGEVTQKVEETVSITSILPLGSVGVPLANEPTMVERQTWLLPAECGSGWLAAPPSLRPSLEEAILGLSESDATFLEEPALPPPLPGTGSAADAEAATLAEVETLLAYAKTALTFDERLRDKRFVLVPSRIKETLFWRHYFVRVLRERRVLMLPPLERMDTSLPPTSTSQLQPPVVSVCKTEPVATAAKKPSVVDTITPKSIPPLTGVPSSSLMDLVAAEAEADLWLQMGAAPTSAPEPSTKMPFATVKQTRQVSTPTTSSVSMTSPATALGSAPALATASIAMPSQSPAIIRPPHRTVSELPAPLSMPKDLPAHLSISTKATGLTAVLPNIEVTSALATPLPVLPPSKLCLSPATAADDLEAKIAAELDWDDEDEDCEDGVLLGSTDGVSADEEFEALLVDDD